MAELHRVEPLTGSHNYHVWELKVSSILRSRKLYKEVIENDEPPEGDSEAQAKARETWETKNDEAFGTIIVTLSPEQAALFVGERSAKKMWNELKRIHMGNVEDMRIDATLELKNIAMKGNETVDEYITRARSIAVKCSSLGQKVEERELVYYVVRGVHPKYETAVSVLRPQRSIKLDEVQQSLREEESRLQYKETEKAYKSADTKHLKHRNMSKKCFFCGKMGHVARDCWHRKGSYEGATKEPQHKYGFKGNRGGSKQGKERGSKEFAGTAKYSKQEHAFTASYSPAEKQQQLEIWNLDSGCSKHMSPRLDWMSNVQEIERDINLAESDRSIKAEAVGDIRVTTINQDGNERNINIKEVLYVPELRTNLLSVHSLVDKGNYVVFDKEGAKIYDMADQEIARTCTRDRTYLLETVACQPLTHSNNCMMTSEPDEEGGHKNTDKYLWHRRLGHINEQYLDRMLSENAVQGLYFRAEKLELCEPCVLGKLSQNPFKRHGENGANKPLELVHMDLCGPMPVLSLGGSKYILTIVDEYCKRIFVYFLKSKEETFRCFLHFKERRETELGNKICAVRTDNGSEFVNTQFNELYASTGIKHQKTVPYTPQSNGTAERTNRVLLEGARTLLFDAELPAKFWAEAVATVAYVKNCTPTRDGGPLTPMERWNGKKPNVKHLRVFGALAYYYIPNEKRNKLEAKAKKGIFIGYSQNRVAYRIFDPETNVITEARTVKFKEKERGADLLTTKESPGIFYDPCNNGTKNELETPSDTDFDQNSEDRNERPDDETRENGNGNRDQSRQNVQNPNIRKPRETQEIRKALHEISLREREDRLISQGVRRSERIRSKQQANVSVESSIPRTYKDALTSEHSESWKDAMEKEMFSLQANKVWKLVPKTEDMKVLENKWVFTIKENSDGTVDTRKARLVVAGHNQKMGRDYQESFAPVIRLESLRTLFAIASHLNLPMKLYDVKSAYLNGELNETVFMKQPEGFIAEGTEHMVCKLEKSLYGLPQSGNCWNNKLREVLSQLGMEQLKTDPCIYILKRGSRFCILGVYVDDIIALGSDQAIIDEIINELKNIISLREQTEKHSFIGIDFVRTSEGIELYQTKYIDKILQKYGLAECKPVKTPGDSNQDLNAYEESAKVEQSLYIEMIGSLLFLAVSTRPDIAFQVCQLSQFNKDPRQVHLVALKRVFRYLQGTRHYRLVYSSNANDNCVTTTTDAGWSTAKDGKSFSGHTIKIGGSIVAWKSNKQKLVALSTCEAELIAICEGVKDLKWITGLLAELGMERYVTLPMSLQSDSKAAIDWIKSTKSGSRTKHINRKYHFVRDEVYKGNISVTFLESSEMESDIFTKNLCHEKLLLCVRKIGLFPASEITNT